MKKRFLEISGLITFLIGFMFMINFLSGMTGNIIASQVNENISSIMGIILIIGGLTLFIVGTSSQEQTLIKPSTEKGIKNIKLALITNTIGDYDKVKELIKNAGYTFVETKEYTSIFSPHSGSIIQDELGYPIVIYKNKKEDKEILKNILKEIVKDNKRFMYS